AILAQGLETAPRPSQLGRPPSQARLASCTACHGAQVRSQRGQDCEAPAVWRRAGAIVCARSEGGTPGDVSQEDRGRHREGHLAVEGHPRDGQADDPEPRGEGRRGTERDEPHHQEPEGAPARPQEDQEHQALREPDQAADIRHREADEGEEPGQGVLWHPQGEVLGSCRAVGCTVDGTAPATLTQMVDDGEFEMPEK
ncbi:unnamed protein product, partial [Prorocentrum cordatum]